MKCHVTLLVVSIMILSSLKKKVFSVRERLLFGTSFIVDFIMKGVKIFTTRKFNIRLRIRKLFYIIIINVFQFKSNL